MPDAAKSGGDSSQLSWLYFFFFKEVMKVALRETGKRVSGDGVTDRREETSQTRAKSLRLHQP